MSSVAVAYSPQLLAEVHTKLAQGPVVDPVHLGIYPHSKIVLVWRELPSHLAAVLALIGGVLFLMVSPTVPYAVDHAQWLVRTHLEQGPAATGDPYTQIPQPRRRNAVAEIAPVIPAQERRRAPLPSGQAV